MVETAGGYDYKYISEVPEDLICSLCHFPFKDPVHIEECGHIYCKECFEQTKDHAAENALDFCCPLDRQKIDVTRVFKDKFNERKVLSLKVECINLQDGCSWTGELRDAIVHEGKCGNNEKLAWERFEVELKDMSSCMKDLAIQVKSLEQRLENKDKEMWIQKKQMEEYSNHLEEQTKIIKNQKKLMDDYSKQIEDQNILTEKRMKQIEHNSKQLKDQNNLIKIQNMEIEKLKKQSNNANQENKEITDLKKQVENINKEFKRKIENQSDETEKYKIKDEIEKLKQNLNSMIMPNIDVDPNFTPVSTAFQWNMHVDPDKGYVSPPFYNIKNGMCFQLGATLVENLFHVGLARYRGKYDHPTNEISTTQPFELVVHIFGSNGNFKEMKWSNHSELHIGQSELIGEWLDYESSSNENSKFRIDGYAQMHLFFNNK